MKTLHGSNPPIHRILSVLAPVALLLCILPSGSIQALPSAPSLLSDTDTATAGFYRLSWETNAARIELQEATDAGFQQPYTHYIGPDRATVISGKPNGTWYYRIRSLDNPQAGPWSEPVRVSVEHHSLTRALVFFGLGVVVFLATLLLTVRGAGQAR